MYTGGNVIKSCEPVQRNELCDDCSTLIRVLYRWYMPVPIQVSLNICQS